MLAAPEPLKRRGQVTRGGVATVVVGGHFDVWFEDSTDAGHGRDTFFVVGKESDSDASAQCGTERTGLFPFGDADREAEAVGEHLRPDRAASTASRQCGALDRSAGSAQGLEVATMFEYDTLEQRT